MISIWRTAFKVPSLFYLEPWVSPGSYIIVTVWPRFNDSTLNEVPIIAETIQDFHTTVWALPLIIHGLKKIMFTELVVDFEVFLCLDNQIRNYTHCPVVVLNCCDDSDQNHFISLFKITVVTFLWAQVNVWSEKSNSDPGTSAPCIAILLIRRSVQVSYQGWQYIFRGMIAACNFKSHFVLDPILLSGYLIILLVVE
jgi:hypothetical protein